VGKGKVRYCHQESLNYDEKRIWRRPRPLSSGPGKKESMTQRKRQKKRVILCPHAITTKRVGKGEVKIH